jgi:hypothetical protein
MPNYHPLLGFAARLMMGQPADEAAREFMALPTESTPSTETAPEKPREKCPHGVPVEHVCPKCESGGPDPAPISWMRATKSQGWIATQMQRAPLRGRPSTIE